MERASKQLEFAQLELAAIGAASVASNEAETTREAALVGLHSAAS